MTPLGRRTASDAREDGDAIQHISAITGLDASLVHARLEEARGKTLVKNVFADEWPTTADLGAMTVARARRLGLKGEIVDALGVTSRLVTRRLNKAAGKTLVRNALWDHWPSGGVPAGQQGSWEDGEDEAGSVEEPEDEAPEEDAEDGSDTPPDEPDDDTAPHTVRIIGPGTMLSSRYEIRNELHRGGFGTTYVAYDRLSRLDIVIKIPHDDDGGAVQREMRHAFRLLHPGICQAFPERDDETDRPFLVLQHGGEDLAQRLARTNQPFPITLAVHVLESLADALDYLHERLVVHLDVSPSNVLIDADDNVRLTDFGASASAREQLGPAGDQTLLATTVSAFKAAYAAPELQYREGRNRSDQFSLALVFCSLLEGRVFRQRYRFQGLDVLTRAQNDALMRALSQHPEDRFPSCGDLACAIADELGRVPERVLARDLDRLSADLLHRLDREAQPRGRGAARLGGVVLVGRALERLLHCSVLWMAATEGFDAEAALRAIDPRSSGLSRATAGGLAKVLTSRANGPAAASSEVAEIVSDLTSRRGASRIWKLINVRNEVVHGTRPPEHLVDAARALADLLRMHRANAGW